MTQPYSREFFAPRPSPATLFFRTFILWQLFRFAWINLKMIRMISKAHAGRAQPSGPAAAIGGATDAGQPSLAASSR